MLKSIILAILPIRWGVTEEKLDSFFVTCGLVFIAFVMGAYGQSDLLRSRPAKFQLMHSDRGWVYRMNLDTGVTHVTVANRDWTVIDGPEPKKFMPPNGSVSALLVKRIGDRSTNEIDFLIQPKDVRISVPADMTVGALSKLAEDVATGAVETPR